MVRVPVVIAVAIVACGKSGSKATVDPGEPGGTVVQVDGNVVARRAGATTAVAVGTQVAADAVIDTGSNGHVIIELANNHARWELGAGKQQRVSDSIVWKVPAGSANSNVVVLDNAGLDQAAAAAAAQGEKKIEDAVGARKHDLVACLGATAKVVVFVDTGPGGLAGFRVKGGTRDVADCVARVLQTIDMPKQVARAAIPIAK